MNTPPPPVTRTRPLPRAAVGLVSLTLLFVTAGGCNKADAAKGPPKGPQAVPVDVAKARTDSVQRTVEVVGSLFGEEDATISNKVNGKLIAIYKDVGDRVAPGEPLAQLLKNDYLLDVNLKRSALMESLAKLGLRDMPPAGFDAATLPAVRRAKLQRTSAESRYNRGKQLHEQKPTPLLSDQDFEDLRTALDVAGSAYDTEVLLAQGLLGEAQTRHADLLVAEQALRDTTVRAPSEKYAPPAIGSMAESSEIPDEGPTTATSTTRPATVPATAPAGPVRTNAGGERSYVVAARMGSEGELAKAVTPLFRLVDDDPLKFRAAAPERFFPEVAVGQKVVVTIEAYNRPFEGIVSRINPQIDPLSRTFPVEIIVPNAEHLLPPGAFARGSIRSRMEPGVVFIPASAVVTFAGVDKVFVVEGGKAREVAVTPGDRRGDEVEIRKGLVGTETVATSGTSRLASGVLVQVKDGR